MSSQDLEDLDEGRSNMFIDNKKLRSIIRKNLLENIKKKNLITENTSNITSKEELADLASDELMPILEISEDHAGEIIMAARAQWFD